MTAEKLIANLKGKGARFEPSGASLNVRAPRGTITDAERQALAEHKQAIIECLTDPARIEACPVCRAEILRVEASPHLLLVGCSVDEGHYFKQVEREREPEREPSLELRMLQARAAKVTEIHWCYSDGCPTLLQFVNGHATCHRCGLDQRLVILDEDLGGNVIEFKPQSLRKGAVGNEDNEHHHRRS